MFPSLFLNLFNSLFSIFYDPHQPIASTASTAQPRLTFKLRHLHAVSEHGHVLLSDVDHALYAGNLTAYASEEYTVDTRLLPSYRPPSFDAVRNARYRSMKYGQSTLLDWDDEEIVGPNAESRETLLTLAKMTNNAYLPPDDKEWYPLGENWTTVRLQPSLDPQGFIRSYIQGYDFGWEPDADGFRGHVFTTPDNSTIVLSIKGTSAGYLGGGGPTAKKDKLNDNLLFSCCCAKVDWSWTPVCDCHRGGWKCSQDCLEYSLITESLFYQIGTVSKVHFSPTETQTYPGYRIYTITCRISTPAQTYGLLAIHSVAHWLRCWVLRSASRSSRLNLLANVWPRGGCTYHHQYRYFPLFAFLLTNSLISS